MTVCSPDTQAPIKMSDFSTACLMSRDFSTFFFFFFNGAVCFSLFVLSGASYEMRKSQWFNRSFFVSLSSFFLSFIGVIRYFRLSCSWSGAPDGCSKFVRTLIAEQSTTELVAWKFIEILPFLQKKWTQTYCSLRWTLDVVHCVIHTVKIMRKRKAIFTREKTKNNNATK